ncbi:MAG TPA: patatin-like phospholipase family protein [Micromonosporaceae bacterium]|nr:patatin-like phospholipase family protein [Micromonosporaceae bacterium]
MTAPTRRRPAAPRGPARTPRRTPAAAPLRAADASDRTGGLGLVLSGGGAPAAYFGTGVIMAMEEVGLRPQILSGVSAGAINAYALGAGLGGTGLAEMWQQIRWDDIYRPRTDLWNAVNLRGLLRPTANLTEYALQTIGWTWLLDTGPARRTFARYLGAQQPRPVGATVIISAVDENSGGVVRFCSQLPPEHRSDPAFRKVDLTVEHVVASTAVPLLFPAGRDGGGHTLVDAGLVANTPLAPVMRYEPDRVIVVSGTGIDRPAATPRSLGDAIGLLADNVAHFALTADVAHAETVNALVRNAPQATDKRQVPMLLIEPTDLGFAVDGFLRFSPSIARSIIEYGREQGAKALAGWAS